MGWFDDVVSTVRNVATKVVKVVRDAIRVIAEKGGAFIGAVKETYAKVKPYLQKLSPYLKSIAVAAEAIHPWLGKAVLAIDKAISALLALENSPILHQLEKAMRWVVELAKRLDERLSAMDEALAREHEAVFRAAKAHEHSAEHVKAFDLAAMINELALVKTGIANLIDDGDFIGFEHYLRLRATQKLIRTVEEVLARATTMEEISADDIFLVQIGAMLLSDAPEMSDAEAARLDAIVFSRYGKKLTPFVFEEMSKMWQLALTDDKRLWKRTAETLAVAQAKLSRLKLEVLLSPLSAQDQGELESLEAALPAELAANKALMKRNVEREYYVYATEGFLQLLEKTPEQIQADDQDFLLELGEEVGLLLTDCAHRDLRWADLSAEQQALIADFANVFRVDSIKRGEELEVECNG